MSVNAARRTKLSSKQALGIVGGLLGVGWLVLLLSNPSQSQATVFGLGQGALVAAIALSITLTFRGSGVVNFSAAAVSMYAGFVYYDLRTNGQLFLPQLPNPLAPIEGLAHSLGWDSLHLYHLPTAITLAHVHYIDTAFGQQAAPAMAKWLAFSLTIVWCVGMGLAFHFLIFRPVRHAPPLAKVVASIGLLILLQEIASLRFTAPQSFDSILPSGAWHIGSVVIPQDAAILLLCVVTAAAAFWALFKYTKFGFATRAAAENERGAVILGINPNYYAGVNWVVSTVLAGAFGVLFASINQSIDVYTIPVLIVPALAAALYGRLTSFPLVVTAGVLIGAFQAWFTNVGSQSWFPGVFKYQGSLLTNLSEVLPFVVIVLVLFFRGERLPTRGSVATLRMPRAPQPRHPGVFLAALSILVVAGAFLMTSQWRLALNVSLVGAVMCASLVILTGFVGQISLMQMTIAGISGFVLSRFCDVHHVPFPIGPLLGATVAVGVGLIAAVPALRIRGVNLAIVTLAAAVVIEDFVYRLPAFDTGFGAATIDPPRLFGHAFGPNDPYTQVIGLPPHGGPPNPWFTIFSLAVLLAVLGAVVLIRRARLGRRMLAVRANERAAAAAGINVAATKLQAFAIAAFVAGLGGALYAYSYTVADPTVYTSFASLTLIAVAYLGGIAMIGGVPIGGIIITGGLLATVFSEILHINPQYTILLAGFGVIFAAINNPEGVAGSLQRGRLRSRLRKAPPAADPHAAAPPEAVTA